MQRQTFVDNTKERGHSITRTLTGNITATKENIKVRLVPHADYGVYIKTSTVTAITATDAETLHIIDVLTVQP